jgi:nucleoside-diphosphate kinase
VLKEKERTLVLLKPDAVKKGVAREILKRYIDEGLTIEALWPHHMSEEEAITFYREHQGKHYFEGLILAMTSGVLTIVILSGENAVEKVRELNGDTNPAKAKPGTIRRSFPSAGGPFNIVHGSDSIESAKREISLVLHRRQI